MQKLIGFKGLSLFYIFLFLSAFLLFFDLARRESNIWLSGLIATLLFPLIASRHIIRPEGFSYLFAGIMFWILWNYKQDRISYKWLFVLPLIELIWVNVHIYFIIGIFIIGLFWLSELLPKWASYFPYSTRKLNDLSLTLGLVIPASFINPFGLKAVLYPFSIFKNYGYRVLENQPVWFLIKIGAINKLTLIFFEFISIFIFLAFLLLFILNRKKFSWLAFVFFLTFNILAWLAIRNFALFGFYSLPLLAFTLKNSFVPKFKLDKLGNNFLIFSFILLIFIISFLDFNYFIKPKKFGLGLNKETKSANIFFQKAEIKEPIFNDYDIGSYLIYLLYPKEKVFVDNRPEAYPVSFFRKIYTPAQKDEKRWKELDKKYNFQSIIFSLNDFTPWGQNFLIRRLNDVSWSPVFADKEMVVFLKNDKENKLMIDKYKINRNYFKVVKLK